MSQFREFSKVFSKFETRSSENSIFILFLDC